MYALVCMIHYTQYCSQNLPPSFTFHFHPSCLHRTYRSWSKSMEGQLSSWTMYIPGVSSSPEVEELKKFQEIVKCMSDSELDSTEANLSGTFIFQNVRFWHRMTLTFIYHYLLVIIVIDQVLQSNELQKQAQDPLTR